ncbi:MAG: alanine racemase [Chloroflexi bacterium]|nr:MAG: alanine racemase [Chloroflexota bacterium]
MLELEPSRIEIGTPVGALDTPCLVVDLDRMERNLRDWQADIDRYKTRLRPHIKTHKVPEIALQQEKLGAVGIACAKVTEAEPFVAAGCRDVVIAYPVVGRAKWERLARLAREAKMTVNVDSPAAVKGISQVASEGRVQIGVQIEVDSGFHRCGFAYTDVDGIETFARLIKSLPGIELEGITTHRGVFFDGAASMTTEEAGLEEGRLMVELAEKLRARGVPIKQVTAGGTLTGRYVAQVPGITEVRAGTYVFFDSMQVGYGTTTEDNLALTILTTVVSHQAPDRATVDGGSKTFSGDRGVVGANSAKSGPELARAVGRDVLLERISEEHGMVRVGAGENLQVGEKVAFYPFHVCTCVNLSDELIGVRGGKVEKVWRISARGKRS